jgi:hypothetical protein
MKYERESLRESQDGTPQVAFRFPKFVRSSCFSSFIFHLSAFLVLALLLQSPALAASTKSVSSSDQGRPKLLEITPALRDYCGIVYACGLRVSPGTCPAPKDLGPPAPFSPEGERCTEARELTRRGIGPDHPRWGFRLYRLLGFEYRVTYEIFDTLPISRERLEYLLADVPLAARLVTHYQDEPYTAVYTDTERNHFKGTNGKHMRGEARILTGSFAEGRLFYLGNGVAEWGFWTLAGPAMLDFAYWEVPGKEKRIGYKIKVVVFPGNGVINTIMNLGVFRNLVHKKISGVLGDISETARKLQATGGKDLKQDATWTAAERRKIDSLLGLPE